MERELRVCGRASPRFLAPPPRTAEKASFVTRSFRHEISDQPIESASFDEVHSGKPHYGLNTSSVIGLVTVSWTRFAFRLRVVGAFPASQACIFDEVATIRAWGSIGCFVVFETIDLHEASQDRHVVFSGLFLSAFWHIVRYSLYSIIGGKVVLAMRWDNSV